MSKVEKRKYYRPGTLGVPGTKITLKTQPYTNGVLFDMNDPISSFRSYLTLLNLVLDGYTQFKSIPGIESTMPSSMFIDNEQIARLKLLLNYLIESPTEIILKDQIVKQDILNDLADAINGR